MASKRLSYSSTGSGEISPKPPQGSATHPAAEEWLKVWEGIYARDLVDQDIVSVGPDTTVEEACDLLLSKQIACIAVESADEGLIGLFDFADVNAFLTLAATRHTLAPEGNSRVAAIVAAAKAGRVPVHLVSNLSEKNPLHTLPYDASIVSLLGVFSRGAHRVLIEGANPSHVNLGFVSDRSLLSHITAQSESTLTLLRFFSTPLDALALPSLYLYTSVIAATSTESVLDAMRLMSDEGVSSVAILDEASGALASAVSVTDIGHVVVPEQSNQILTMPLSQLVSKIREPFGSTDGNERYPVYSVVPSSTLSFTIQKLLATNSHRLFVTSDATGATSMSLASSGNLCGVVSIVDILSLFARFANVPDVDPLRMQRRRRASTSSSRSGSSRSSSRASVRVRVNSSSVSPALQSPGGVAVSPAGAPCCVAEPSDSRG